MMRRLVANPVLALAAIAVVCALGRTAAAYPQFQMSRDVTCSSCHITPDGGGLLNENGLDQAELMSKFGTNPKFLNGVFDLPKWLMVGGDFLGAAGFVQTPQKYLELLPMQADIYASAKFLGHFRVNVTVGYRPPQTDNAASTSIWSREHFLMWQQHADDDFGLFVRAGRFMPIFGLRFSEHPLFVRQYGGTPLYSETYGAAVEYIEPRWEAHVTGFIKDPLLDPVRQNSGAAFYAEGRPTKAAAVGLEGMVEIGDDCTGCTHPHHEAYRGGVTGKYFVERAGLQLQGEVQYADIHVETFDTSQLVGTVMLTKFLPAGLMADLAFNYFSEDLAISGVDREAFDLNLHWFATSHVELMLTTRLETTKLGIDQDSATGAPIGSYALAQLHYRL